MKKLLMLSVLLLAGCCGKADPTKPAARFEVVVDQAIHSERHSNFSIMVIKDKKTEKEFTVIYSSSWGVVQND